MVFVGKIRIILNLRLREYGGILNRQNFICKLEISSNIK
jgi:hypothetical protein